MAQVKFLPEVVDQFLQLANILYDEGYLGFKDAAIDYSERLFTHPVTAFGRGVRLSYRQSITITWAATTRRNIVRG